MSDREGGAQRGQPAEIPAGYKRTEIEVIPEEWEITTLSAIGTVHIGLTYDPSDVADYGTLVLRSSNIGENTLQFTDNVYVRTPIVRDLIVKNGDLLICVRNGSRDLVGKCAIIDDRAAGMSFGAFMSIFRSPSNPFIFYAFQSTIIKKQIQEHLGATINQITNKSLNSFTIPLPPLPEQRAIAAALSDVDALIAALDALIAKKRGIKRATMQQLLTGKTRLKGFSGAWAEKRLGEVAVITMGQSPASEFYNFDRIGLPLIQGNADIENRRSIERVWTTQANKRCNEGDILLTVRAPVGFVGIATREACLGRGVCGVQAHQSTDFLFHQLVFREPQWKALEQGSTFTAANSTQVEQFSLSMPAETSEQCAIAEVLSDMDAAIEALEARREKTRQMKQGMMQQLLTGKVRLPTLEAP